MTSTEPSTLIRHHDTGKEDPGRPYKTMCACGRWFPNITAHLHACRTRPDGDQYDRMPAPGTPACQLFHYETDLWDRSGILAPVDYRYERGPSRRIPEPPLFSPEPLTPPDGAPKAIVKAVNELNLLNAQLIMENRIWFDQLDERDDTARELADSNMTWLKWRMWARANALATLAEQLGVPLDLGGWMCTADELFG